MRSRHPPLLTAACALALLALAGPLTRGWCQGTPGVVRGVVRSASGDEVPFALVTLTPGHGQRFTDQSGRFAFTGVAPGSYRLVARQVGYRRFDAAIVVTDSGLEPTVRLERVVVEVAEITVTAPWRCTAPGPPDPALNPALAAVFEELRENARRYWLFAGTSGPQRLAEEQRLLSVHFLSPIATRP